MQTLPRSDSSSDAELAGLQLEQQARTWRVLALGSVICSLNVFLGIVAAILSQLAMRAARRHDLAAGYACLRWARLLTLIGILLFGAAAAASAVIMLVIPRL
jgi:multisubunit Na+/H+ antiporter MnhE subunit